MNHQLAYQSSPLESLRANLVLASNEKGFTARTLYHKPEQLELTLTEGIILRPTLITPGMVNLAPMRHILGQPEDDRVATDDSLAQKIGSSIQSLERKFRQFGTTRLIYERNTYDGEDVELLGFRSMGDPLRAGNLVAYFHAGRNHVQNLANKKIESLEPHSRRYLAELIRQQSVSKEYLLTEVNGYAAHADTHTVNATMHRLRSKLDAIGFENAIPSLKRGVYTLNRKILEA